ncbi:hypothetical protein pb186bvf_003220 [Paramecium bursaria]
MIIRYNIIYSQNIYSISKFFLFQIRHYLCEIILVKTIELWIEQVNRFVQLGLQIKFNLLVQTLKPWIQIGYTDRIEQNHIILRRLENIDKSPFSNLTQQLKSFKKHQEIINNRQKWFRCKVPPRNHKSLPQFKK